MAEHVRKEYHLTELTENNGSHKQPSVLEIKNSL